MSISNKKKFKLRKNKKNYMKRILGIIMFITGIILLPLIIIVLIYSDKTKLSFIAKMNILMELYVELLTGEYKSLKHRK